MPAMIDQPEGWRYGLPKPDPDDVDRDEFLANINTWLVANSVPA